MKRRNLIKHLQTEGVRLLREGAKHSVYYQPNTNKTSTVPRHSEIHPILAKKICLDLGIRPISKK